MTMGISLLTFLGCSSGSEIKVSDHYNGEKFVNPTLDEQFSPGLSDIYKMMREGRAEWPEEVENLGIPKMNECLENNDFSITFINHATFLIQTPDLNILTDPVWSKRASPISWVGPKRVRKSGVKIEELPHIDLILLSHNHYDHLDKATLKTLNEEFSPQVLVPIGDKDLVESIGFEDVKEMDWWDEFQYSPDLKVIFTPAQHSSGRGLFDRDKSLWGSFYIKHKNLGIYFGGDQGYSKHFKEIQSRLGSPEVAMLGIGAYLPNFFMKYIHTSPAEALQAHLDLGAKQSIGMHYGTFQLASEGFNQPLEDLKIALINQNLPLDEFITLLEGGTKIFRHNDTIDHCDLSD